MRIIRQPGSRAKEFSGGMRAAALALKSLLHNCCRVHGTQRVTLATEVGPASQTWDAGDLLDVACQHERSGTFETFRNHLGGIVCAVWARTLRTAVGAGIAALILSFPAVADTAPHVSCRRYRGELRVRATGPTFEIVNISDDHARFTLRLRGLDGNPVSMPFFEAGCPSCLHTESKSVLEANVAPGAAYRAEIAAKDPLRLGWAEFSSESEDSFAVSAMIEVQDDDGTIELIGIPAASENEQAWLYVDHRRLFSTELALVNLNPAGAQAIRMHYRGAAGGDSECQATVEIDPLGGTLFNLVERLPCSASAVGSVELRGEGEFAGVAIVSAHAGGVFSRQIVGPAQPLYPALALWTVSAGQVSFGASPASGCMAVQGTAIGGSTYTVHTSKWQRRDRVGNGWTDVPGTSRSGQICPYTPSEQGEYRGIAEITIGSQRGTFTSSGILSEGTETPSLPTPISGLQEYTNSVGMEFVRIPAGTFQMGSTGPWASTSESPLTQVTISEAFWMEKHEVTQGQWQRVMEHNPWVYHGCGSDCPGYGISWDEAQEFIEELNESEGETRYRLPTEAEWEYAARAGTVTDTYAGNLTILGRNHAPLLDAIAWYGGNSGVKHQGGIACSNWRGRQNYASQCGAHPVGQKAPNQFGLHDMLGNVWEWVQDGSGAYPGSSATDPVGGSSQYRVLRGGAYNSFAFTTTASFRNWDGPHLSRQTYGIRVVRLDRAQSGSGSGGSDETVTGPTEDPYEPLEDWTVSNGRVQFFCFSAG